jgi:hypothetical protein
LFVLSEKIVYNDDNTITERGKNYYDGYNAAQ